MKDLLLFIVKALVDEPEAVNITEIDEAEDSDEDPRQPGALFCGCFEQEDLAEGEPQR